MKSPSRFDGKPIGAAMQARRVDAKTKRGRTIANRTLGLVFDPKGFAPGRKNFSRARKRQQANTHFADTFLPLIAAYKNSDSSEDLKKLVEAVWSHCRFIGMKPSTLAKKIGNGVSGQDVVDWQKEYEKRWFLRRSRERAQ